VGLPAAICGDTVTAIVVGGAEGITFERALARKGPRCFRNGKSKIVEKASSTGEAQ
jgi:hypothetical protein